MSNVLCSSENGWNAGSYRKLLECRKLQEVTALAPMQCYQSWNTDFFCHIFVFSSILQTFANNIEIFFVSEKAVCSSEIECGTFHFK